MTLSYRVAKAVLGCYITFVGLNIAIHGGLALAGSEESRYKYYEPHIKERWRDYSDYHKRMLHSPWILVPLEILDRGPEPPPKIKVSTASTESSEVDASSN